MLGARASRVARLVVSRSVAAIVCGITAGVVGAFLVSRLVERFLYGVQTLDPGAFITALLLLVAVATVAVWLPTRRATHISPVDAVRAG